MTEKILRDAPVEVPILSVAGLAREGFMGSKTKLRLQDGFIENSTSQQRQHFVKRKGVYFTKLHTERRVDNHPNAKIDFAYTRDPQSLIA